MKADDISIVPPEDFTPDDAGEGGQLEVETPADNSGQQNNVPEEKHFTRAEVDRIIGERLSRERSKYQGVDKAVHRMQEIMGMPNCLPLRRRTR